MQLQKATYKATYSSIEAGTCTCSKAYPLVSVQKTALHCSKAQQGTSGRGRVAISTSYLAADIVLLYPEL